MIAKLKYIQSQLLYDVAMDNRVTILKIYIVFLEIKQYFRNAIEHRDDLKHITYGPLSVMMKSNDGYIDYYYEAIYYEWNNKGVSAL